MSAFNPAAIRLEEDSVRQHARELLAEIATGPGTVDMVPAFTTPLPNDATVHLLGFPMKDSAADCHVEQGGHGERVAGHEPH